MDVRDGEKPKVLCLDLAETDYSEAFELQRKLVYARVNGALCYDVFLFLQHPPVFTLGRRGGREFIKVSEGLLERAAIPVIATNRGGSITYHGPGQVVMYTVIDLETSGIEVVELVGLLEEVMIRTATVSGVKAGRDSRNRGVWVGSKKLGSVGLAVECGVTYHGIAFNVDVDLAPFSWINPCGLTGVGMTSLSVEIGNPVGVEQVLASLKANVEACFSVSLMPVALKDINSLILSSSLSSSGHLYSTRRV